jgi:hypothetical protein
MSKTVGGVRTKQTPEPTGKIQPTPKSPSGKNRQGKPFKDYLAEQVATQGPTGTQQRLGKK